MLDNLARGRFDFGVGKGVRPGEFARLGLRFEDGVAMTEEAIEGVVQRPHPPLHEVASRPASVARVGARGCRSRCTSRRRRSSPAACRTIATRWRRDASRSAPARTGPRLVLCRETYVAERAEVARAEGALALQGFWHLSSLAPPPPPAEFSDVLLKDLTARVWGGQTYDELDAIGGFLIGAPDQVTARGEAAGIDRRRHAPARVQLRHPVPRAGLSLARAVRRRRDPPLSRARRPAARRQAPGGPLCRQPSFMISSSASWFCRRLMSASGSPSTSSRSAR